MSKFSLKSFLIESGFIQEVSSDWRNDFITGAKNMPKTTDAVLDYIQDIYFTAFGGEQNVQVINKKMARWLVEQVILLGGPANIDTTSRNKILRVMQWFRIAGAEGNIPKMTLDAAFALADAKIIEREQKAQAPQEEPEETEIEKTKLVKRIYTLPDGSGRFWVEVDQKKSGDFFDTACRKGRAYGVGCQSRLNGHMVSGYRSSNRKSFSLLGPAKDDPKGHVSTLMALSVNSDKDLDQARQSGNQEIGSNLDGYTDLFDVFIEFLGSTVAKQNILKTSDNGYLFNLFRKNNFDLANKLDALRPDLIENQKETIKRMGPSATEWLNSRNMDAVQALQKFGPERFLENIETYVKSKTFKEALVQLAPLIPKVSKKSPGLVIGKINYLLDFLPIEIFKEIIQSIDLKSFIKNQKDDFERLIKKLNNVNSKDAKEYREIFKYIIENNFEDIIRVSGKGLDGVKKFMNFLEMPKSEKHQFVKRTPEGKIIALRKEVKREGGHEEVKDVEFELPESLAVTTQKERRDLLKKNEDFIKSLVEGDTERKDINFLRLLFSESNSQDVRRTLKNEKEKFIQYYDNPKHLTKYNFVRGVPLPGIFEFYRIFNKGQVYGVIENKEKPYYKFDLEDLRDPNISRQVVGFFTKLYMADKNAQIIGPEGQYEILDDYIHMLDIAGESPERILEILNKYKPSELSFYKGKVTKISPIIYQQYYNMLADHTSKAHALNDLRENMSTIVEYTSLNDYEKLVGKYATLQYDVEVGEFVEYIGPKTSDLKQSDPQIDADRGRKYNVGEVIDNELKDKIRIYDNTRKLSDFVPTKWFNVGQKPLNESSIRNLIKQALFESVKKIKSEKETLKELQNILGKDAVFLTQKNGYGDRRKYAFGFWIKPIAQRYGAIDKAPPGYSNQYDFDISDTLEEELKKNGFKVVNIHVGSWVHGWIHRVVTKEI